MSNDTKPLTAPQRRCLNILAGRGGPLTRGRWSARDVAHALWPDSPAWLRRTHRRATPAGGALGATMPMKAGTLLNRLWRRGYVTQSGDYTWQITQRGLDVLNGGE